MKFYIIIITTTTTITITITIVIIIITITITITITIIIIIKTIGSKFKLAGLNWEGHNIIINHNLIITAS